jgi:hypothetical protein
MLRAPVGQYPDKTASQSYLRIESKGLARTSKRTAKPLYVGSIPTRASNLLSFPRHRYLPSIKPQFRRQASIQPGEL